jgi:GT2 family glycosyltransferase
MSSVDVIVPCYRYGRYLRECVDSVLNQAGVEVRVLIIDDASPDDSAEVAAAIAASDARVNFIHHKSNRGHIATYNEGIEWLTADYMLLLSADDYLLPCALGRAVGLMDQNPDITFTFSKAIELRDDGSRQESSTGVDAYDKAGSMVVPGIEFIQASGARNIVPTPTAVVRTAQLKKLGGYRPELPHSGDMEMWLRLAAHGRVGIIGECLAVYRRHASNMSTSYFTNGYLPDLRQRQAALDWFLCTSAGKLPDVEHLKKWAARVVALDAIGLAHRAFDAGDAESAHELSQLANTVCPEVWRSVAWLKLAVKYRLGPGSLEKLKAAFLMK